MFKQLREDIACIHKRDPAARSRWEILTCYPGLHAILVHRLSHKLWNHNWLWLARFLSHLSRMLTGIEIHPGARIGNRVFFDHGFGIVIGETAIVGDDCTIYQGVTLGGTSLYKGEKRHPTLEQAVVVGAGAQILGGFTVGAGARIGSNAVVVKPIPAGATAVGNPARIISKEKPHSKATDDSLTAAPESAPHIAATSTPDKVDLTCQSEWSGKPLHELLDRSRKDAAPVQSNASSDTREVPASQSEFAAYAVDQSNNDPLVQVINELVNHAAKQDARINRLCHALEELGQRVENGSPPLDTERLNKMME
ncbi:serine O-acetyltransferase [Paenalcaligenes niemegkensis]|uniref:serine O-acetyltransferase n=1 Tax=Paenalcaligenes niemegkensis TaxID=2895469 RepID=UPI001EE78F05|nr:serine O-acetyltransferase [Paenalcaligenes niemegkensis]MCQ9615758.1 serine O-acetyltransferase [Paenalcaligenes niemegkensis]